MKDAMFEEIERQIVALGGKYRGPLNIKSRIERKLVELAKANKGPVSTDEVYASMPEVHTATLRAHLATLVREGRAYRVERGWYVPKVV